MKLWTIFGPNAPSRMLRSLLHLLTQRKKRENSGWRASTLVLKLLPASSHLKWVWRSTAPHRMTTGFTWCGYKLSIHTSRTRAETSTRDTRVQSATFSHPARPSMATICTLSRTVELINSMMLKADMMSFCWSLKLMTVESKQKLLLGSLTTIKLWLSGAKLTVNSAVAFQAQTRSFVRAQRRAISPVIS